MLKSFDTRPSKKPKLNRFQKFFVKHKRLDKAFTEFGIIWFTIASVFLAYAAGVMADWPNVPGWLPFLLVFYAPYFAYQVQKWSENRMRSEYKQEIEKLEERIEELERNTRARV